MGEREYKSNDSQRLREDYSFVRESSSDLYSDGRNPDFSYVGTEATLEELMADDEVIFATVGLDSESSKQTSYEGTNFAHSKASTPSVPIASGNYEIELSQNHLLDLSFVPAGIRYNLSAKRGEPIIKEAADEIRVYVYDLAGNGVKTGVYNLDEVSVSRIVNDIPEDVTFYLGSQKTRNDSVAVEDKKVLEQEIAKGLAFITEGKQPNKTSLSNKQNKYSPETPSNRNKTEALDPGWGAGFDEDYFETQEQIRDGLKEVAPDFFNIALDFVPLVGDVKGIAEAIIGKDITGNELAAWERALGAVPVFGGFLKKVDAGNKVKGFIRMPGVWVAIDAVGTKIDELIEYLISKLPDWRQRTVFAMAEEGGFEAPEQIRRNMVHAIEGGTDGRKLIDIYLSKFDLDIWNKLQLNDTIKNIITNGKFTTQQREEVIDTLVKIEARLKDKSIDIGVELAGDMADNAKERVIDSGLKKNFREVVKKLNDNQINVVEENLAELENAIRVIEEGNVDGIVSIGVEKGHKPKGLPEIDVDKVEADTYFKTSDGVIHLNEVKNTPNAFVSKLKDGISKRKKDKNYKGQFERYGEWIEKGTDQNQVRKAMVFIRNSEPKFHRIIDKDVLEELSVTIAKNDKDIPIIQVKNRKFTYNELQEFYQDADKKLGKIIKQEKKRNPNVDVRDLISSLLDDYFGSMEKAFETMGKTYGH